MLQPIGEVGSGVCSVSVQLLVADGGGAGISVTSSKSVVSPVLFTVCAFLTVCYVAVGGDDYDSPLLLLSQWYFWERGTGTGFILLSFGFARGFRHQRFVCFAIFVLAKFAASEVPIRWFSGFVWLFTGWNFRGLEASFSWIILPSSVVTVWFVSFTAVKIFLVLNLYLMVFGRTYVVELTFFSFVELTFCFCRTYVL